MFEDEGQIFARVFTVEFLVGVWRWMCICRREMHIGMRKDRFLSSFFMLLNAVLCMLKWFFFTT